MPQPGDRLMDWCSHVLGAVQQYALLAAPDWTLPDRQLVTMGAPAWDCEELAVWCQSVGPHEGDVLVQLGNALTPSAGHSARVATIGVSIVRCAPDAGEVDLDELPSAGSVQAVAEAVYPDQAHVMNALLADAWVRSHQWAATTWTPEGPDGGFAGSTLLLQASLLGAP